MAAIGKRSRSPYAVTRKPIEPKDARRMGGVQTRVEPNGKNEPDVVLCVVGGDTNPDLHNVLRSFPLVNRGRGQTATEHLAQVVRLVEEAIAAGGTHLLVPREEADWLADHPLVADYFAAHHVLADASAEQGIVFALRPRQTLTFTAEIAGWEIVPSDRLALLARDTLIRPRVILRPTAPPRGLLSGHLAFSAAGLRTLRVRFGLNRAGRRVRGREVVLSLARPGQLMHDLPFVEVTFEPGGAVRLEFDLRLDDDQTLDWIRLAPVEEDNWRLHPGFRAGSSFALPATAPVGAWLELRELSLAPTTAVRNGPSYGIARGHLPAPYRKPAARRRDAVLFSSWVPEEGLALGRYFIETLRRYHADSKIFVGINHGSSPQWIERLEASGLDVTVQPAASTLTISCDPTGFVAALDAYRRHAERFDLVWFGHTKGVSHLDDRWYRTGRWTIERMFWGRRAEIERYFQDPTIGLYTPHYMMMKQSHLRQIDALRRMYQATCLPLGVAALSTHFVMRDESVRDFCARVDKRFFREGPEPFGGDMYFFEMGMPNVATMQGHEPSIEPGLGGTTGPPKPDGVESIRDDWRQNNAVVAFELEKWRRDPTGFRTQHRLHTDVD